jgi:hypothetical protein
MKQLLAVLGALWGLGNLSVAVLFVISGFAEKTANKGGAQQALLVLGGLLIGIFAVILLWQCLALARSGAIKGEA